MAKRIRFLRYPGGKQRLLPDFADLLPARNEIAGYYIEPFLGGASVFFHLFPTRAILSDINRDLMDLYIGVRESPEKVWNIFTQFPSSKSAYYKIRKLNRNELDRVARAARILYLNRTCFKGMWRHNASGKFNVGYGGQDRRWVISKDDLIEVSKRLEKTELRCGDFEDVIELAQKGDFLFIDPPYCPGDKEMFHDHYSHGKFTFVEQRRLAQALKRASRRGVMWVMTNTSHEEVVALYAHNTIVSLSKGTGEKIGQITAATGEVVIYNY